MKKLDDINRMLVLLKKNRRKNEEIYSRLKSDLKKYDKQIKAEESLVREMESKYFPKAKANGEKL